MRRGVLVRLFSLPVRAGRRLAAPGGGAQLKGLRTTLYDGPILLHAPSSQRAPSVAARKHAHARSCCTPQAQRAANAAQRSLRGMRGGRVHCTAVQHSATHGTRVSAERPASMPRTTRRRRGEP